MTSRQKFQRLAGRMPARCLWLGLPSPAAAEIAGHAGAELAVIDREHGAIGTGTMVDMLRALAVTATPALVRVPELSEGAIKQALDGGAAGIVVPNVQTPEEATRAVRAALYAPEGQRGAAAGVVRATGYGRDRDYVAGWNARAIVALQIESRKGRENAAAIAAVAGVDMLFFGPFDYAQEAGLDAAADGAALADCFADIVAAARGAGGLAGVFPWPGATPAALAKAGADLIAVASDIVTLSSALSRAVQEISLSSSDVS